MNDQVRIAFELTMHIDMTRYAWTGTHYVHKYDASQTVRADRINTLLEGFVKGAGWAKGSR